MNHSNTEHFHTFNLFLNLKIEKKKTTNKDFFNEKNNYRKMIQ